jgi:YHS domain-containing protein
MRSFSRRNAIRTFALLAGGVTIASASGSWAGEAVRLALKGYDPVAYFTLGKATLGSPDIDYEWDERRYRFASVEHRDAFKADPVRYAPQFANYCAMALAEGHIVDGNPEYWMISDGKLYLFGKPIGPDLFKRDLADNLAKAEDNRFLVGKN